MRPTLHVSWLCPPLPVFFLSQLALPRAIRPLVMSELLLLAFHVTTADLKKGNNQGGCGGGGSRMDPQGQQRERDQRQQGQHRGTEKNWEKTEEKCGRGGGLVDVIRSR